MEEAKIVQIPEQCLVCRFWKHVEAAQGMCRKKSPKVLTLEGFQPGLQGISPPKKTMEIRSVFPPMNEDGWCGDFERRSESETAESDIGKDVN